MATKPFAFNPSGTPPLGATQVGNIAVFDSFPVNSGSLFIQISPDDSSGYLLGKTSSQNRTYPIAGTSSKGSYVGNSIRFYRSVAKTDSDFITAVNKFFGQSFNSASAAKSWIDTNGHWTSYVILPSYLLDTYSGAAAAYSVARRLSSTYTGALIRVRRSSDNAEQDIGYTVGNVLDESALTTFVGANNGFVVTIYDQSGNNRNQSQSTVLKQPRVINSGVLETVSGKPSINFINGTWMRNSTNINVKSIFTLSQVSSYVQLQSLIAFSIYTTGPWVRSIAPNYYRAVSTGGLNTDDYTYNNDMYFNDHLHITSDSFLNKHILSSFGNVTSGFGLSDPWYGRSYIGKITEAIIYGTDEKSGYRTGITSNLNTFYSIY